MPQMASQMVISGANLNSRPVSEPAEILEAAPGLAVVQHSGSGKANQYYLRGYNLDHGTDMATFWDDVPINLPTNAHGQGYTDLNFLIPETISGLEVRKGPYWADVGDFDNAGAPNISLRDSIGQNIQSVTAGSFGYTRLLSYGSVKVGGGSLLYAGEFNTENGPWDTAEDLRKFSGLLRYSQGTATDGFSATAMAYANSWNASDQIALRAITTGQVGLFGEIDPTDGGDTSRFMLSTRFAHSDDNGMWKANAYVVKYTLNLFNNFTWFTTNPTLGDQFHQSDDRIYSGGAVSRTFNGTLFSLPSQTVVGLQTRDDDINVGLTNTFRRQFLSNTLFDHVNEGNVGVYAENTTRWTDWWRTTFGLRGDYFAASVNSMLQPANSGNPNAALPSPKFTSVFGPFYKTEFFLGAGLGYHSNDARGVVTSKCLEIRARRRAARLSWCGRPAPRSAPAPRSCLVSIARSACSPCVRIRNCSSTVTPAPRYPVRRASAPVSRSPTIISRCLGCASMPIWRSAARALSAPILLNRSFSIRSPVSRKRRSATRQEISFRKRHGWSRRPASRSANEPAGSARCAGAISVRGRSPRTAYFSRRPSIRSTAGWGISSPMAGASSLTRSIC